MLLAQVYNFSSGFSTGQICVYFQNPAFSSRNSRCVGVFTGISPLFLQSAQKTALCGVAIIFPQRASLRRQSAAAPL
jgi:hypothetical protein